MKSSQYEDPAYWCGDKGYRFPGYGNFIVNALKEVAILLLKPESVLDVGCAYGYSVAQLNALGIPSKGADISKYAISQCPGAGNLLVQAPAWDLPFEDNQFDLLFSSGMLEHIPKRKLKRTIAEMVRVSRRGLIGVACSDDFTTPLVDKDSTHEVIKSGQEWQAMFPPEYKIISDSTESWRAWVLMSIFNLMKGLQCIKHPISRGS